MGLFDLFMKKKQMSNTLDKFEINSNDDKSNVESVFQESVIIDVTNFEAKDVNDSLGYMTGGIMSIYSDGFILIDSEHEELEKLHISEITRASNNINNFDPTYITAISLMTQSKQVLISFQNEETKTKCWATISNLCRSNQ